MNQCCEFNLGGSTGREKDAKNVYIAEICKEMCDIKCLQIFTQIGVDLSLIMMWFKFFSLPLQAFRPYFVVFLAVGMSKFCANTCKK